MNGTVVAKRAGNDAITYTFQVDEAFKGVAGKTVKIHSAGVCRMNLRIGAKTGMFLDQTRTGVWYADGCSLIGRDELREAAAGLPEPDGAPPAKVLVAGSFGEIGTVAMDEEQRFVSYGYRDRDIGSLSVCPGASRFTEMYYKRNRPHLVVRELPNLEEVRDQKIDFLPKPSRQYVSESVCRAEDGSESLMLVTNGDYDHPKSSIWRVGPSSAEMLVEGQALWGETIGDRLYMREEKRGRVITYFDLITEDYVRVAFVPKVTSLSISPDGNRVIQISGDNAKITLADFSSSPTQITRKEAGIGQSGEFVWLDDHTVVLLPGGYDNSKIKIYNDQLELLDTLPGHWYTLDNEFADGVAWGVGWGGLYRAELPDGEAELVHEFFSPVTNDVEIIEEEGS